MSKIEPLAQEHVALYESPDPERIWAYSPGLARLASGRLVATLDLGGPGVRALPGPKWEQGEHGYAWQGKVYVSDDGGRSWQFRADYPFMHARPFAAGGAVYVLGQAGDLMIFRSADGGQSWSDPTSLTSGDFWHQAPSNVHEANGCVYLVMERRITQDITAWYPGELAPVLMRARMDLDLRHRESWEFSEELSFRQVLPGVETDPALEFFGVPFYGCPYPGGSMPAPDRVCAPMGWLESNVVQFTDPDHIWHDPEGRTLHLWMRAHTGGTGYAAVAKAVEQGPAPGDGAIRVRLETVPSGKKQLFVPCPGGQMKFHVLQDPQSGLYWLLSTQATDSMTRADRLPPRRFNLPNNERRRLQLHFSKNMVDWCFAGLVAAGPADHASRHYASMVIDGEDLAVLSRSGDAKAQDAHNGNLITFHRITRFRDLVY